MRYYYFNLLFKFTAVITLLELHFSSQYAINNAYCGISRLTRLQKYENHDIIFLPEETESNQFLLGKIPNSVKIIHRQNGMRNAFFILFPVRETKSYSNLLKNVRHYSTNVYVIIWPIPAYNVTTLRKTFADFWLHKIINVAVIVPSLSSAIVYTYIPYAEYSCNNTNTVKIVAEWTADVCHKEKMKKTADIFTNALINLNGCKLRCYVQNRPPDSLVFKNADGDWVLEGMGGRIMNLVQSRLNFTADIVAPDLNFRPDKYGFDRSENLPEMFVDKLSNFHADLAFGIFSHIVHHYPALQLTASCLLECAGAIVPAKSGEIIPTWKYYTSEFEGLVWTFLLVQLAAFLPVFRMAGSKCGLLQLLSLQIGVPLPAMYTKDKRFLLGLFILPATILTFSYQSSLGSLLAIPWKRKDVADYEEILDGDFAVSGGPFAQRILMFLSEDSVVFKKLSDRFQPQVGETGALIRRLQHERIAVFGILRFGKFYISAELGKRAAEGTYELPTCLLTAHASPFMTLKGSPFYDFLNDVALRVMESGLAEKWYEYATPKIKTGLEAIQPLNMHKLKFVFLALVVGHVLSILTFLCEISLPRFKLFDLHILYSLFCK